MFFDQPFSIGVIFHFVLRLLLLLLVGSALPAFFKKEGHFKGRRPIKILEMVD